MMPSPSSQEMFGQMKPSKNMYQQMPYNQPPQGMSYPPPGNIPSQYPAPPHMPHYSNQYGYPSNQMPPPMSISQIPRDQLLGPIDIKILTQNLSNKEVLDPHVERILASMAEEFVQNVSEFACKLAKHRGSDTLEKVDMKFAIEKLYNIPTPIKPSNDKGTQILANIAQATPNASTTGYKQNIALVKKANESGQ